MSNMISVSQFNNYVHNIFIAEEILQNIQIYGEVSGLSFSGNNLYFSIKDENAVLSCVKFGYENGYIPKEGEMILVVGSPNYYVKGGRFSFNVVRIAPYGQGELYKQFLELKAKLESLGMFDQKNKKALPAVIKRVGVVSSETGAVIQDIIDITSRRNPMLDIVLYPAKVQGIGAEATIIAGIKALDETNVDVIIVARGGGSAEDLSTFNSEALAYAIFEAKKPIISAVGHETDFTIADFVSDLRAPTPSAGAELVAVDLVKLKQNLNQNVQRLVRSTELFYDIKSTYLQNQNLKIDYNIDSLLNQKDNEYKTKFTMLNTNIELFIKNIEHSFELKVNKLDATSPIKILKMGYSQATKDGKTLNSIKEVRLGDQIDLRLQDGLLSCEIKDKKEIK